MAVRIPEHLKKRFEFLEGLRVEHTLPAPWRAAGTFAVGGLTEVGFADSSDLLICVSSAGRGVFDCMASDRIARDDSEDFEFDSGNLLVAGIGPLEGQRIRTAGISGGGLASTARDGWGVERHPFSFPDDELFFCSPGQTMLWTRPGETPRLTKLGGFVTELRAFGFSPTGRSFVIATSSDVLIYVRE
ncbi:MAG: hypothetical protein K8T89_05655 [Planctomycetes bacterium]|nr:hypothetical protein [Planctomycetota bacterium]